MASLPRRCGAFPLRRSLRSCEEPLLQRCRCSRQVFPRRAPPFPLPLQAGISAVPTFKVFHNDKVTAQFSGAKIDALQAAVKALVEAK